VFSKFNRFALPDYEDDNRQIIVGESLDMVGIMNISFTRTARSNLLMIGDNTDKARNLFFFAVLSFCIDNWLKNGKQPPKKPAVKLFNFKPLNDDYFIDTLAAAAELLPRYIEYIDCSSLEEITSAISDLYNTSGDENKPDSYAAVFGYQRAEALKSTAKLSVGGQSISLSEMFLDIMRNGSEKGVHTIMWQDKLNTIADNYADIISLFNMRIAFEMSKEALIAFIMEENTEAFDENSAIYFNSLFDNRKFRVYQSPRMDWIKFVCEKLNRS
ncbi:MAG: hypothetical protein ACI4J8_02125, partial [Oscillospiraceae bacterium]